MTRSSINHLELGMKKLTPELMKAACLPHSEKFSPQDNYETQRKADHLWDLMGNLFTDKWIHKNGAAPSSIWMEAISALSGEQLRLGVMKCKEKIFAGDPWPPDLADFLAMIHGQTDIDYHAAFMRCLNKSPLGRVEQWVYENAGYNIRTASHEAAERMHKKFMKEAFERERNGRLNLASDELKCLPINSVKNTNDLARERYEEKHGKELNPRIKRILESKEAKK